MCWHTGYSPHSRGHLSAGHTQQLDRPGKGGRGEAGTSSWIALGQCMCDIGDKKVHCERAIRLHSLSLLGALLLDTPNSLIGRGREEEGK